MIYILYTYISKNIHSKLIKSLLPQFSIDFQEKIKRYRRWEDAQLTLLGRTLLFEGCEKFNKNYIEEDIAYTKYNKPYFKDGSLYFNISHSGNIVICALCDFGSIGIDIEILNKVKIEDFKTQMTFKELDEITNSTDRLIAFYKYWTQKEAVIKTDGKGLSIPLNSFEISQNKTMVKGKSFFLKEIKLDSRYECYVATEEYSNLETILISEICPPSLIKSLFN